ncbi:MAG: hypothetical protein JXA82_03175 [Sedimentisphaerales bacterium]|nr:hypothetical protein [Sedimentisphaerales bacterium]
MNPFFQDHIPYLIAGPLLAGLVCLIPKQKKISRFFSLFFLGVALQYVLAVFFFYSFRNYLGEGYSYIVLGIFWGIGSAILAGVVFALWLGAYLFDCLTLRGPALTDQNQHPNNTPATVTLKKSEGNAPETKTNHDGSGSNHQKY